MHTLFLEEVKSFVVEGQIRGYYLIVQMESGSTRHPKSSSQGQRLRCLHFPRKLAPSFSVEELLPLYRGLPGGARLFREESRLSLPTLFWKDGSVL